MDLAILEEVRAKAPELQNSSFAELLASLSNEQRNALLAELSPKEAESLNWNWQFWARPKQIAPSTDWRVWMIRAGRGFGKSRTGAEMVRQRVESGRCRRISLVARTASDIRDVMIEGQSGIMRISPPWNRPKYEPTKRRLTWPNGAVATTFSADQPDALRGPECDLAWCDELATWRYMEAWDNLMFGLRLGVNPQCVVTTTPRPIKVIRDLEKDPHCIVTTGSTLENSANLAPSFLSAILRKYEGTRLGRQEILAEILEDIAGAVFQRAWIDAGRRSPDNVGIKWPANKLGNKAPVKIRPEHMERMCVAIDPAMTSGEDSNETGIVVAGRDSNRHGYVFDDASGRMAPSEWVNTAVRLYNLWECDYIVAEVNNGGAMIANAIHQVDENIRVKEVIATRGKIVRAEPVGMVYEQGRGHHVGSFPELEDQMCRFTPDFIRKPEDSPDRMDALVWAFTDLIVEPIAGMGMFQYTKELAEEMAAQRGLRIIDGGLAA